MKKLENLIMSIIIVIAGLFGFNLGDKPTGVDKALGESKRYLIYSDDILSSKNPTVMSTIMSSMSDKNSDTLKIEGMNAFTVKSKEDLTKNKVKGWNIIEERVYKVNFLTACAPIGPPQNEEPEIEGQDHETCGLKMVKAVEASALVDSSEIKVAVIDTGIDRDHSEFKHLKLIGKSFVEDEPNFQDENGHGTHVAGIISAAKDKKGMFGVSKAQIISAKALDSGGSGLSSWIGSALKYSIEQKVDIINMSLGSAAIWGVDPFIQKWVEIAASKGIQVFMATGNDSGRVGAPALLAPKSDNLFAVSSVDCSGNFSSFSSRGSQTSLTAPGDRILSTALGGGYVRMSGTSMATPFAAGVAALAKAAGKPLKYDDLGLPKEKQGLGLVNALKSVQ